LPFYAILRSFPSKLGGILCLLGAILILALLPYLVINFFKVNNFILLHQISACSFVLIVLYLGWLGGNPVEYPFLFLGQQLTLFYFLYLFFLINFGIWITVFYLFYEYFYSHLLANSML